VCGFGEDEQNTLQREGQAQLSEMSTLMREKDDEISALAELSAKPQESGGLKLSLILLGGGADTKLSSEKRLNSGG
jgi:hypothetical protein